MATSQQSQNASTEMPSFLDKNLQPVAIKYIALPFPLKVQETEAVLMTLEDTGAPCRRCLLDAKAGESVNLVSYDPFPSDTKSPYRGSSPIFVHTPACEPFSGNSIPARQLKRLMSLRAYDQHHMMVAAETVEGHELETMAGTMLSDPKASYVNVHNAKPGCFAFRVERA